MAGAKPHLAPHAAYAVSASASASAPAPAPASDSTCSDSTASAEADVIVFRLLLPRTFGDGDAFHLYAAITPLLHRTAALQVRVDTLEGYSEDCASRVAVVLGPTSPSRRVEASSSSGEPLQLSPVQEALIALVDVGRVLHRAVGRGPEFVTCLVLVEATRLDAQGRGTLRAIASETGAEILVTSLAGDAKPSLHSTDELIEITGDRTTIRKAIVALSSYVRGDLHAGSLTTSVATASPKHPRTTMEVSETNFRALHSGGSTQYADSSIPRIDSPQDVTGDVESKDQQKISFRLLCHVNLAGGLIGVEGMLIKSFESETGANIDVGNPLSGCMERVITISALESPGSYSKVQKAILCIFERMEELERDGGKPGCSARVLVPKSQFCWLVGLGGAVIKEMVKSTGAGIEIMDETDVPACASHCERVLQITGELVDVRNALIVVNDKLHNHAFSSKSSKYDDANATSSDTTESTPIRQIKISSTSYNSTENFLRIDDGASLYQMDSVENSFRAFHLESPGSSELEKPANANDIGIMNSKNEVQKSAGGTGAVIIGMQKPADGGGNRINNSCIGITSPEGKTDASCLSPDILELIIRRLPPNVPVPSFGWHRMIQSVPRPTLLVPGHADDEWQMLLPARLALRGDTLATSTLDAGQALTHTTVPAPHNLGIPASVHPTRLIGGHPSHPIFMQGQMCIICNVVTSNVYRHRLLIPGREEEHDRVLRGAVSYSLLSAEPGEPAGGAMLLLATDSSIFGRLVKDRNMPWAVGSLSGVLKGTVTDILFSDGGWYLMDDGRHLYRVFVSELNLLVLEVEVEMIPAQIFNNVRRHWILQWPEGSILCICLQNRPHLPLDACYSAYLLRYSKGDRSSWQKLHYLHQFSVFINSGKAQAFALKYPKQWGLKKSVVYHNDLTEYDLAWTSFPNGLPAEEVHWPFSVWLLCMHLNNL